MNRRWVVIIFIILIIILQGKKEKGWTPAPPPEEISRIKMAEPGQKLSVFYRTTLADCQNTLSTDPSCAGTGDICTKDCFLINNDFINCIGGDISYAFFRDVDEHVGEYGYITWGTEIDAGAESIGRSCYVQVYACGDNVCEDNIERPTNCLADCPILPSGSDYYTFSSIGQSDLWHQNNPDNPRGDYFYSPWINWNRITGDYRLTVSYAEPVQIAIFLYDSDAGEYYPIVGSEYLSDTNWHSFDYTIPNYKSKWLLIDADRPTAENIVDVRNGRLYTNEIEDATYPTFLTYKSNYLSGLYNFNAFVTGANSWISPPGITLTSGLSLQHERSSGSATCTLGMIVEHNGQNYILTAGHCVTIGVDGMPDKPTDIGRWVKYNNQIIGYSYDFDNTGAIDAALVSINPGVDSQKYKDYNGVTITGFANPVEGQQVYKYGQSTGLTYGTISDTNVFYQDKQGNQIRGFEVTGNNGAFSSSGDSGSAVITTDTHKIVGILSAGGGSNWGIDIKNVLNIN